uniref:Saposin A-type domain-containing protein n=1 Tax=Heterorhabditis bacteriophora TaxID=37862 RepID=A0A1I7XUL4_HETBA
MNFLSVAVTAIQYQIALSVYQYGNHYAQQQYRHTQSENQDYPVKAYQTHYPSSPSHHYTNQPTHLYCNIPPDLWCDSPQAAQQCGVQRQCDSLRQNRRQPLKITLIYESLCPYCQKYI